MKNSLRNNKLWEGHRLYYPEMRDLIIEGQKEKVSKPQINEEKLMLFDETIRYALNFNHPLLVSYYSGEQIKECVVLSFKFDKREMVCENGKRIKWLDIVDVELC